MIEGVEVALLLLLFICDFSAGVLIDELFED